MESKDHVLIVKQFNDYACFLACLESFLSDQRARVSQMNICEAFPECCDSGKLTEGTFQLINSDCLKKVGKKCGFEAKYVESLPQAIAADETIFIIPTNMRGQGSTHCVRFNRFLSATEIEVMDPKLIEYDRWALDNLKSWKCNFLKLVKLKEKAETSVLEK